MKPAGQRIMTVQDTRKRGGSTAYRGERSGHARARPLQRSYNSYNSEIISAPYSVSRFSNDNRWRALSRQLGNSSSLISDPRRS